MKGLFIMKSTRIIALLLVVVMCFGVLASCKKPDQNQGNQDDPGVTPGPGPDNGGEVEQYVYKQAEYNKDFISIMESEAAKCGNSGKKGGGADDSDGADDNDPKFREAVKLAIDAGKISTSLMQRNLGVGYGRAAKIIDQMEDLGYVSPPDGNKPRRVLITMQEFMEKVVNDDLADGGASAPSGESEE